MYWLWTEFGVKKKQVPTAEAPQGRREAPRQHHRPHLRHLQHLASDLAEIRRLVEGIGAEINMCFPLGSHLADVPKLANAEANICMYREYRPQALRERSTGPICRRRSGCIRPPSSCASWARSWGSTPSPSSTREKHTTIKPLWDLWRSVTQDFFGTASFGVVANETYARGLQHFLEEEMGLPCNFAISRKSGEKTDNEAIRKLVKEKTPLILFGSYNERMYLAEAGGRAMYIPASFPGAIIRRHTGTPFMGYAGATYLIQEVCNALFDALFNILPLGHRHGQGRGNAGPARAGTRLGRRRQGRPRRTGRAPAGAGPHFRRQAPARRGRGPRPQGPVRHGRRSRRSLRHQGARVMTTLCTIIQFTDIGRKPACR